MKQKWLMFFYRVFQSFLVLWIADTVAGRWAQGSIWAELGVLVVLSVLLTPLDSRVKALIEKYK